MSVHTDYWFGRKAPEGVEPVVEWGARAIFTGGQIDTVHDRQQMNWDIGTQDERNELGKWIIREGMKAIRAWVKKNDIGGASREVFHFEEGGYMIEASPMASYGYLYIWAGRPKITPKNSETEHYYITPTDEVWSGDGPVPPIGTAGWCTINNIGYGTVEGYFRSKGTEGWWLGVIVTLDPNTEPDWHKTQCKGKWTEGKALVFGREFKPDKEG